MDATTRQGAGAARGPTGPSEEGDSPRRSGLAQRPGSAGLISKGKKSKGF
jgi:hypothetical protein